MDVTVKDARNRLDQLLELADRGIEVVVKREGKPPVRLVLDEAPVPPRRRLRGPEFLAAVDRIVQQANAKQIPPELRTSDHDELYDEHGAPK